MVIITTDPYWIYIIPLHRDVRPESIYPTEKEYWMHNGKWVIEGAREDIYKMAFELDPLVDKGLIQQAKFTKKDPKTDPLAHIPIYAMCVYSDDRKRDEIAELLSNLGYSNFTWKYDFQTLQDWSTGGALAEETAKLGRSVDPKKY